jgi:hypothetical protein
VHTSAPYHTLPSLAGVGSPYGSIRKAAHCAPLTGHPFLIVEHRIGHFTLDLLDALDQAGAEMVVARDAANALASLRRYEFSACLIGSVADPPENYRALKEELADVPVLLCGDARTSFSWVDKPAALLPDDVQAIVTALTILLR